jgi:hypothetical protein
VKDYIRQRLQFYAWGFREYGAALKRGWSNPKQIAIKIAVVLPLTFAYYMIFVHGAAAADTPTASCAASAAAQAGSPGMLSQSLAQMGGESGMGQWMANAINLVRFIFFALLFVQITQDVIDYLLQTAGGGSLAGFFGQYGRILFTNLLIVGLFVNLPAITTAFFSSASYVGQQVSGIQPGAGSWYSDIFSFQPNVIADEGSCLQSDIDTAFASLAEKKLTWSWTNMGQSLKSFAEYITGWIIASLLGASVANIAYLVIACIFTFVALEVYFVAGLGMITAGAMSYRPLWFMPMAFRTAAFGLFMKVASLGAIASFGTQEADTWASAIMSVQTFDALIPVAKAVMYGCIAFTILVVFMPAIIGKHFGGAALGSSGANVVMAPVRSGGNTVMNRFTPRGGGGGNNGPTTPSPTGGARPQPQSAATRPTMSGTP